MSIKILKKMSIYRDANKDVKKDVNWIDTFIIIFTQKLE